MPPGETLSELKLSEVSRRQLHMSKGWYSLERQVVEEEKKIEKCFWKLPFLPCMVSTATAVQPNGLWNSQKTFYKTFSQPDACNWPTYDCHLELSDLTTFQLLQGASAARMWWVGKEEGGPPRWSEAWTPARERSAGRSGSPPPLPLRTRASFAAALCSMRDGCWPPHIALTQRKLSTENFGYSDTALVGNGDWHKCHFSRLSQYPMIFRMRRSFLGPKNGHCRRKFSCFCNNALLDVKILVKSMFRSNPASIRVWIGLMKRNDPSDSDAVIIQADWLSLTIDYEYVHFYLFWTIWIIVGKVSIQATAGVAHWALTLPCYVSPRQLTSQIQLCLMSSRHAGRLLNQPLREKGYISLHYHDMLINLYQLSMLSKVSPTNQAVISGWGTTSSGGSQPNALQKVGFTFSVKLMWWSYSES